MVDDYAIALSGGGARGIAHAGILKALNEFDIYPKIISASSAGAIVGALYADGKEPDEILEIFLEQAVFKILRFKRPKLGFFGAEGLKHILQKHLKAKTFNQLNLKLYVCATNINTAKPEYFNEGNLIDVIMASSAFPLLIKPYPLNNNLYIDGGVMDNLPVSPLFHQQKFIIGAHVNPVNYQHRFRTVKNYMDRILHMGLRANMIKNIEHCSLFIEPPNLSHYNLFSIGLAKQIFKEGYQYTKQYLKDAKF